MTGNQQDAEKALPEGQSGKLLNADQSVQKEKDGEPSSRDDNENIHIMEVDHEVNDDFGDKSASDTTVVEEENYDMTKESLGKSSRSEKNFQSNAAEKKKYKCDVCLERFSDKTHLTTHEKTHTMIKPFKCDVCGVVVSTATSLRLHLMGHTGNYKFTCDVCDKGFIYIGHFKKHKVTHTRKYEFECQICKKKFFEKRSLDKHMLVHEPVRELPMYRCHLCSFSTHRRCSVRAHLILYHVPSTSDIL